MYESTHTSPAADSLQSPRKSSPLLGGLNGASFFTFLSRNKAYTAINVFGFSISLMFVLLIGVYTIQSYHYGREESKADRMYFLSFNFGDNDTWVGIHHAMQQPLKRNFPEIEATCGLTCHDEFVKKDNEYITTRMMMADSTFIQIFDLPLVQGNRAACLKDHRSVVLTESFARKMFGTANVVGRQIVWRDSIRLNVTAVAKDMTNALMRPVDMIAPFYLERYVNLADIDENFPRMVNMTGATIVVLTRKNSGFVHKEKKVTRVAQDFFPLMTDKNWNMGVKGIRIMPYTKLYLSGIQHNNESTRSGNAKMVHLLFITGFIVLFFAIINYINLTVAQSGYRAREMATHRLFGAQRSTIMRRLMSETTLLCLLSALIGVLLALIFVPSAGRMLKMELDMTLLLQPIYIIGTIVLVLLVGILSGLFPALVLSRANPIEVVRGTFRHRTKMVFRRVFIVLQNTVTIVLIGCALTMVLQVRHLINAPMGFRTDHLITIDNNTQSSHYQGFLQALRRQPFVVNASASMGTPVNGGNNSTMLNELTGKQVSMQYIVGDTCFMRVWGLKIDREFNPGQGYVFYLTRQAIAEAGMKQGQRAPNSFIRNFRFFGMNGKPTYNGVLHDFKIRSIEANQQPMAVCVADTAIAAPWQFTVQVQGDEEAAYRKICDIYHDVFHCEYSDDTPFVDQQLALNFEQESQLAQVVTVFAFIAVVISILGLVAMSTYFIQQRQREIAVRKVFGSTGTQIRRRLVRMFLTYVGIGLVIASPLTWYFMNEWIAHYTYRIAVWPWITVAGIIVGLISLAAVAVQSYVASNENPVKHIRQE